MAQSFRPGEGIGMTRGTMFHDANDAERKTRTVKFSEREVRAARRLLSLIVAEGGSEDSSLTRTVPDTSNLALVTRAQEEFENRRRRIKIFGRKMFGEPAWDMLLALYINDHAGPRQTVGSLIENAGMVPSTGKRWIEFLVDNGFIARDKHPNDARTHFVFLTDRARALLRSYFSVTFDSRV